MNSRPASRARAPRQTWGVNGNEQLPDPPCWLSPPPAHARHTCHLTPFVSDCWPVRVRELPTVEFYRACDKVMADILRQYPGTPGPLIGFSCGLALGRWEAKNGVPPRKLRFAAAVAMRTHRIIHRATRRRFNDVAGVGNVRLRTVLFPPSDLSGYGRLPTLHIKPLLRTASGVFPFRSQV